MKKLLIITFAIMILAAAFQAAVMVSASQAISRDDGVNLATAGSAVLELQNIVIRKNENSPQINFRVIVKNVGTEAAANLKNNLVVCLRVRNSRTGAWDELQKWSNIDSIKPGEAVARDRTPVASENEEILSNKFTLQAEIVLKKPGTIKISKAVVENSYPEDSIENP